MSIISSLPYNLQNGQVADATQVMANFNQIVNNTNANAATAGANSNITSLSGLTTPLSNAQGGTNIFTGGTTAGSANAQSIATLVPSNFALTAGNIVTAKAGFTNTGAATLNANSTGATGIMVPTNSGLQSVMSGEIVSGVTFSVIYDGTEYVLLNPALPQNYLFTGGTTTGSANAQALATTPPGYTLTNGNIVTGTAGFTNTGNMTLAINLTTATGVVKLTATGLTSLVSGDIQSGCPFNTIFNGTNHVLLTTNQPVIVPGASYAGTNQAPVGTTSGTQVMMGLAGSITPTRTGKIFVIASGYANNANASAGFITSLMFGTGSAPVNGAASTGTQIGSSAEALNATNSIPFTCQGIITGQTLSPATPLWLDLKLATTGGGTATIQAVTISAIEL